MKKTMKTMTRKCQAIVAVAALLVAGAALSSCEDELGRVHYPDSTPEISSFSVQPSQGVTAGDPLYVSVQLKDDATPLSTMRLQVASPSDTIVETIRTKGNDFTLGSHGVYIPFVVNMQPGERATVSITVTNVEGGTADASTDIAVNRPAIPATIYFVAGTQVIELHQSADNPFEYESEEGIYDNRYSGKIATTAAIDGSTVISFNYIWICRDGDTAPDCFWMVGHGFTCAPVWNDFYTNSGGWNMEDITQEAYIVKTGDNRYQCTVYLNNHHIWDSFEAEFYSDREWGKDNGMLIHQENISGDATGIVESNSNGITSGDGFVPGYYRLTFDTSGGVGNEKLNIERIGD